VNAHDVSFRCMGCEVRLIVGDPLEPSLPDAAAAAARVRDWLDAFDARLSRFRLDSELTALNEDPREAVPASGLLRAAVGGALWAARWSGGLVDPTLLGDLEEAGYRETLAGKQPASLREALEAAPPRAPAAGRERWRSIRVDDTCIRRPPGLRLDLGGTGKGLAADAAANLLDGYSRFLVDCGGDIRVRGAWSVQVEDPFSRRRPYAIRVDSGAVATSGIDRRIWRAGDAFHHHMLDPATGRPAWTGLVAATALAPTTLAAETLAKTALLSGPGGARALLSDTGGRMVHDDGTAELVGPLGFTYRLREAA
jgi:thiamine biosynthesis lipoprotein